MSQSRISFEDYDAFVEKFKPKRTTVGSPSRRFPGCAGPLLRRIVSF